MSSGSGPSPSLGTRTMSRIKLEYGLDPIAERRRAVRQVCATAYNVDADDQGISVALSILEMLGLDVAEGRVSVTSDAATMTSSPDQQGVDDE